MRLILAYNPDNDSPYVCGPCMDRFIESFETPAKRVAWRNGPEAEPFVAAFPDERPGQYRYGLCTWCGHAVWLGVDGIDFKRAEYEPYEFADWAGDPYERRSERAAHYIGDNWSPP